MQRYVIEQLKVLATRENGHPDIVDILKQRALEEQQNMRQDLAMLALASLARKAPQETIRSAAIGALVEVQRYAIWQLEVLATHENGDVAAVDKLKKRALEEQLNMCPDLARQALIRLSQNAPQETIRSAAIGALVEVKRFVIGHSAVLAENGNVAMVDKLKQLALAEQQNMRPDLAMQALIGLSQNAPQETIRSAASAALAELEGNTSSSPQNSGTASLFGTSKQDRNDDSEPEVDDM